MDDVPCTTQQAGTGGAIGWTAGECVVKWEAGSRRRLVCRGTGEQCAGQFANMEVHRRLGECNCSG